MKKLIAGCLLALPLVAAPLAAQAQQGWPSKPVRWLVPYPAGGGSDFLARTIGQQLSTQINQPVLVDNKPGGNTAIAAADVARSAPDGYTVLSADNGTMVFNPALYKSLSYSPTKDLAPVALMGRFPMILVVSPTVKAKDAKEFIAQVKASAEGINYASAGAGSPHHLAMELLKTEAGLKMTHAPYRGAAPALADVAGGQVPAMMVDMAAGAGFIKGGKVRPLAVANAKRLPQLPDVPTFAELGHGGATMMPWWGLMAPAGLPAPVVARLSKELEAATQDDAVRERLKATFVQLDFAGPQEFARRLDAERKLYGDIIKAANIKLE